MESGCVPTETLLRAYGRRSLACEGGGGPWTVGPSPLGGRGLFTTRDLAPGDLIFRDTPVVSGPRAKVTEPMCASCHRVGRVSSCPGGCLLPVCSPRCGAAPVHQPQCRLLRGVTGEEGSWRLDLLGTVAPLRCLTLTPEDREVVQALQANRGVIHGLEVDLLKRLMGDRLNKEDEEWMRLCCCAMDANAFEFLQVHPDGSTTSLRGLYPLAAIMNNDCSPNSCHVYDSQGVMKVFAARAIGAGEEVTTAYSALLWSTSVRRINLSRTKHFLCNCHRCAEPTELGSLLSCLACVEAGCHGLMLPVNPLQTNCRWLCHSCGLMVSPKQAAQLQSALGLVLQKICSSDPLTAAQFLSESVGTIPPQSQIIQQIKNMLLWELGYKTGFTYPELSEEMLNLKEQCCRDILTLLDTLKLGLSRMRGLVLLELHGALCERINRNVHCEVNSQILKEMSSIMATARLILGDDAAAQRELNLRTKKHLEITATTT